MNITEDFKMVIVLDQALPVGLLANTSAVLALTLGKEIEGLIGKDLFDGNGNIHLGLTNKPLPILKSTKDAIQALRQVIREINEEILCIDVTDAAQTTTKYKDYEEKLKNKKEEELVYLGIALAGPEKLVKKLTGSLGLLR